MAPVSLSGIPPCRGTKQIAPFPESVPHYEVSSLPNPHTSLPSPPRSLNTWTISPFFPVSLVLFLNVCPHRFGSRPRLPAWLLSELPIAAGLASEAAPSCRHKETFGMCTTKTPERDLTASRAGSLLLGARVLLRVCRQNRKERCRGPLEGASVPYALIFVSFFFFFKWKRQGSSIRSANGEWTPKSPEPPPQA